MSQRRWSHFFIPADHQNLRPPQEHRPGTQLHAIISASASPTKSTRSTQSLQTDSKRDRSAVSPGVTRELHRQRGPTPDGSRHAAFTECIARGHSTMQSSQRQQVPQNQSDRHNHPKRTPNAIGVLCPRGLHPRWVTTATRPDTGRLAPCRFHAEHRTEFACSRCKSGGRLVLPFGDSDASKGHGKRRTNIFPEEQGKRRCEFAGKTGMIDTLPESESSPKTALWRLQTLQNGTPHAPVRNGNPGIVQCVAS